MVLPETASKMGDKRSSSLQQGMVGTPPAQLQELATVGCELRCLGRLADVEATMSKCCNDISESVSVIMNLINTDVTFCV